MNQAVSQDDVIPNLHTADEDFVFSISRELAKLNVCSANQVGLPVENHVYSGFVGSVVSKLFEKANDCCTTGNFRRYLDYVCFALPRVQSSYCTNGLDLVAPFLTNERKYAKFVEIGDGIPLYGSLTALLEAAYGWSGLLIEANIANIDGLKSCRKARISDYESFLDSRREVVSETDISPTAAGYSRLLSEMEFSDQQVDFLSINICTVFDVLNIIDFAIEKIPVVHVVIASDRCEELSVRMTSLGYEAWIPEFFQVANYLNVFFILSMSISVKPVLFSTKYSKSPNHENTIELLSCHFPKTGGASLLEGLKSHYGDKLFESYANIPGQPGHNAQRPLTVGNNISAVHGHFHIRSYINLNPKYIVVFIRNPLDLLISFYEYMILRGDFDEIWKYKFPPITELTANGYAPYRVYFGDVDPELFDFIGCTETFESDLERLSALTGIQFPAVKLNASKVSSKYYDDPNLLGKLKEQLADEYLVYNRLLARALR